MPHLSILEASVYNRWKQIANFLYDTRWNDLSVALPQEFPCPDGELSVRSQSIQAEIESGKLYIFDWGNNSKEGQCLFSTLNF